MHCLQFFIFFIKRTLCTFPLPSHHHSWIGYRLLTPLGLRTDHSVTMKASGKSLSGEIQTKYFESFKVSVQSVSSLQQWAITFNLWEVIKINSCNLYSFSCLIWIVKGLLYLTSRRTVEEKYVNLLKINSSYSLKCCRKEVACYLGHLELSPEKTTLKLY